MGGCSLLNLSASGISKVSWKLNFNDIILMLVGARRGFAEADPCQKLKLRSPWMVTRLLSSLVSSSVPEIPEQTDQNLPKFFIQTVSNGLSNLFRVE